MREHIGPYRVEKTLGTGEMGIVYKGFHEGLGRYAAIKALDLAKSAHPDIHKRLASEAQAQARLQHPNIVSVYDLIEDHGELFIAMEYVEGTTLDVILMNNSDQGRPGIPLSEALPIFQQLLEALEYAHQHGVVHRDIKPSNVMVENGQAKLMDFGIALLRDITRQTSSGIALGTPAYMSPEQIQSSEVDCRTDIYSAAAVLFEMFAGQRLFSGKSDLDLLRCHLNELSPDLKNLVLDLPTGISNAVAIALEKDPNLRFHTAKDFLHALQEGFAGFLPIAPSPALEALDEPVPTSAITPTLTAAAQLPPSLRNPPLWHSVAFIGLLCLGVVLAFGLWKAWYQPSPLHQSESHPAIATPILPNPSPAPASSTPPPAQEASLKVPTTTATPPKKPRPAVTPVVAVVATPDPSEFRRQEADRLREEVREEIKVARADLEAQSFDSAQEKLDLLMGKTQKFPTELRPESEEVRSLRKKVNEALVAEQTKKREEELQQAAWESRLQQIQKLIVQERFPEAENLARDLSQDQTAPESVSARARQLRNQAKDEIKKAFEGTTLGPTKNKLRKPPV